MGKILRNASHYAFLRYNEILSDMNNNYFLQRKDRADYKLELEHLAQLMAYCYKRVEAK